MVPDSTVSKQIIEMFINSKIFTVHLQCANHFFQTLGISREQKDRRFLPHEAYILDEKWAINIIPEKIYIGC